MALQWHEFKGVLALEQQDVRLAASLSFGMHVVRHEIPGNTYFRI